MTDADDDVAGRLADLNAYGRALNRAEDEEHVVSLTLEAMSVLLEHPRATFVLVRSDDPVVADSTHPDESSDDDAVELARRAVRSGETVTEAGQRSGEVRTESVAAVPVLSDDGAVAVLLARGRPVGALDEAAVRPLEMLAAHVATALGNIRYRENLERAHRTLSVRAELLDLYGQLFRHHLRNDLNIVAGYTEMLADGTDDAEAKLATVRETVERSIDLVDRVSALHVEIESIDAPEPRSLEEAVRSSVGAVDDRYDGLSVAVESDDLDCEVYAGRALESVFTNLLENAAVHNEGPVTVTVEAETPDPSTAVVTVADDGRGIPESVRGSLFELGEKSPDSRGVGLGLGFVRRLVETYGGSVALEDGSSGGAAFRIVLERA